MKPSKQPISAFAHSIGARLTLLLGLSLVLYLVMAGMSIQSLLVQTEGLKELSGKHYERALRAAELTRDAEVIAAQTFENILSTNRSVSEEGAVDRDLIDIYQSVRQQLTAVNPEEQTLLEDIDLIQKPYFSSLEKLSQRMKEERQLKEQELSLLSQLQRASQQLTSGEERNLSAYLVAQKVINTCLTALKAEKNGQLYRLKSRSDQLMLQLSANPVLLDTLQPLVNQTFELRKPLIQAHRATLASAREARLYAQRLTTSSFNYFQSLKKTAYNAARAYEQSAQQAFLLVGLFSIVFLCGILAIVIYIRRQVVERLNLLSETMSAHVSGSFQPIPTEGHDEISVIGQAFQVFVNARNSAEQRLSLSQEETEQANQQLRKLNRQLLALSETDPLTGLANRRHFDQRLQDHWQMSLNLKQPLGLMMCDIDHFKAYNDRYGHQAGDTCLKLVAETLKAVASTFPGTLLGRYGGEEFILLQSNARNTDIQQFSEALRSAIEQLAIEHKGSEYQIVTLSIGATACEPSLQGSVTHLISHADKALYMAKDQGRNRAVLMEEAEDNAA